MLNCYSFSGHLKLSETAEHLSTVWDVYYSNEDSKWIFLDQCDISDGYQISGNNIFMNALMIKPHDITDGDILPPPSLKLRGGGFSVKNTSVSRLPELMGFPVPCWDICDSGMPCCVSSLSLRFYKFLYDLAHDQCHGSIPSE
jgi:hypothetical protein